MKKSTKIGLGVGGGLVLLGLIVGGSSIGTYNNIVTADESVHAAMAKIDSQYQRRNDLIPQLVSVVSGAAKSERATLDQVVKARASATGIQLGDNPSAETIKKFQDAQSQVSGSLSRLLVVSEQYPELKSQQGFIDLQAQIEGTENRIAVARNDYNETARGYNTLIGRFPTNVVAGFTGQNQRASYFEADKGADKAPTVNFDGVSK